MLVDGEVIRNVCRRWVRLRAAAPRCHLLSFPIAQIPVKQDGVSIRLEPHLQHALGAHSDALAVDQSETVGSHRQSGQVDHRGISGFNGDAIGFAYEKRPNMARGVCIDNDKV